MAPIHHLQISSQTVLISFLQPLDPIIGLLQVSFHASIVSWSLIHKIITNRNIQQFWNHVALDPPNQWGLARHIVNMSVIHKKTIKMVVERHRGVKSVSDGLLSTLIDWQGLEGVRIDPRADSQLLVFNELLLNPGEAKLCVTIIILEAVPAHHVQDVKDSITLTVDAVKDGVLVPVPALVPVASR